MDVSTVLVIVVMTALSFGVIVWLELYSRRRGLDESGGGRQDDLAEKQNMAEAE